MVPSVFLSALIGAGVIATAAQGQLQVLPTEKALECFGGGARPVRILVRNPDSESVTTEIGVRIFQATSATAARLKNVPWKTLQVLPGQTIVESASLEFPSVKAETRFIVEWLSGTNSIIGKTDVLVYPTNLLAELKPLAGEKPPGVLDPNNQLKPLLRSAHVEFTDLEETAIEDFSGRLAVIGPFSSEAQMPETLASRIRTAGRKALGIVWIQPPAASCDKPQPSFYAVSHNGAAAVGTATVIVQPELVADLADRPQSQLDLIHFCKLALHPEPLHLPNPSPKL